MVRLLPFVLWAVAAVAQSNDSVFDVCPASPLTFSVHLMIWPDLALINGRSSQSSRPLVSQTRTLPWQIR